MIRQIIAATGVAGALTLGFAGAAGAATGTTGSTGAGTAITPSTTVCSLLPQIKTHVQNVEARLAADLPKAQAREATAKAAGHTKLADFIANRITKIQDRENKVNAWLAKLSTECSAT